MNNITWPSDRTDYSVLHNPNNATLGYRHVSACLDCGAVEPDQAIQVIREYATGRVQRLRNYYVEIVYVCRCPACGGEIYATYFQRWSSKKDDE